MQFYVRLIFTKRTFIFGMKRNLTPDQIHIVYSLWLITLHNNKGKENREENDKKISLVKVMSIKILKIIHK